MSASLVGSEMCIRDRAWGVFLPGWMLRACPACFAGPGGLPAGWRAGAVSRRGWLFPASARLCRLVCLVLFWPLPRAYRPLGPL
eukprot:2973941-Alexandrium_andersonii.AAC.1